MFLALGLALLQGVTNPPSHAAAGAAMCVGSAWREAFKEKDLECVATHHGVVIAPAERAKRLAPVIDAAGERYAAQFANPVQPVAIVSGGSVSGSQAQFLRQHGFLSLAFPDVPGQAHKEVSILPHELAHVWFNAWYDSGRERSAAQYASTAPDWLDETVAILNEDEQGVAERRDGLAKLLGEPETRLYPLSQFLQMTHPSLTVAAARTLDPNNLPPGATVRPDGSVTVPIAPGTIDPNNLPPGATRMPGGGIFIPARPGEGPGASERAETFTSVTDGNLNPAITRAVLPYYIQALAFADFLRESSGNPRIMMEIASAMRAGRSFEQWLEADGQRHGLAIGMTGLTTAWEAWLQQKRQQG
jgi:hypothetical protein